MLRYWVAACLLTAPGAKAGGEEIFGLNSRAVDISAPVPLTPGQYAAAFVSVGADGRPNGVTVQSRYTRRADSGPALYSCTVNLGLPTARTAHISHPALSASGWLFVSAANTSTLGPAPWKLYAVRRRAAPTANYCSGWNGPWTDLGYFEERSAGGLVRRPVASAPDTVVVSQETYVFVTGAGGFIDFRRFDGERWLPWATLLATRGGNHAFSKPAVATYAYRDGLIRMHIFWLDASRTQVSHQTAWPAYVRPWSGLIETHPYSSRPFGNPAAPASTACSAGPEIREPGPLFVVCGVQRRGSVTTYAIARLQETHDYRFDWSQERGVEMVGASMWINRTLHYAVSAPALGPSGVADAPLMFVAFGPYHCPVAHIGKWAVRPAPGCTPLPFLVEELYRGTGDALRDWEPTPRVDPASRGSLY